MTCCSFLQLILFSMQSRIEFFKIDILVTGANGQLGNDMRIVNKGSEYK